jgi:hypothetical protein
MPSIKFFAKALVLISFLSFAGPSGCGDDAKNGITKLKTGTGGPSKPSNPISKPEKLKAMQEALNKKALVTFEAGELLAESDSSFAVRAILKINGTSQDSYRNVFDIKVGDKSEKTFPFKDVVLDKMTLEVTTLRIQPSDKKDYAVLAYQLTRTGDDLKLYKSQYIVVMDLTKKMGSSAVMTQYFDFTFPTADNFSLTDWVAKAKLP